MWIAHIIIYKWFTFDIFPTSCVCKLCRCNIWILPAVWTTGLNPRGQLGDEALENRLWFCSIGRVSAWIGTQLDRQTFSSSVSTAYPPGQHWPGSKSQSTLCCLPTPLSKAQCVQVICKWYTLGSFTFWIRKWQNLMAVRHSFSQSKTSSIMQLLHVSSKTRSLCLES